MIEVLVSVQNNMNGGKPIHRVPASRWQGLKILLINIYVCETKSENNNSFNIDITRT